MSPRAKDGSVVSQPNNKQQERLIDVEQTCEIMHSDKQRVKYFGTDCKPHLP